jgi:hypothetical protein
MSIYWKPKSGKLKVNPKDDCVLEFRPGQPIRAICMCVQIDHLDRVFYELELYLTDDWDEKSLANAEKTYTGAISGAYVFPIDRYLRSRKSLAQ